MTSTSKLLYIALFAASVAQAQQQAPLPADQTGQGGASNRAQSPIAQPKSNLGKQVAPNAVNAIDITMPKPSEIVEQTISDMESTQITDAQYERLKNLILKKDRQKASPYVNPAKPVTRTLAIDLDPGVSPPPLRLAVGQLTSLVFSDASGQPWMIVDARMNRKQFDDGRGEGQGGAPAEYTNVLPIEPLSTSAYGNVSVRLKGLPTPVIFILTTGQPEVDLRVDAKVPGRNPDALESVSFVSMPNIDVNLTAFLDGVPPRDARRLSVSGMAGADAWLYQENLYLRTDAEVQYPAYIGAARSTSGKAVYRFKGLQNSVTVLAGGKAMTVFIEESKENQ